MYAPTDLCEQVHRRSAPPDWLVPISPEGNAFLISEHVRTCGVSFTELCDYQDPCEPIRFKWLMCPVCTDIVFAVALESCEHLEDFVRFGVQVRWWAT